MGTKMVEEDKAIMIQSNSPTQPTLLKPIVTPSIAHKKAMLLSLHKDYFL